MLFRCEDKCWKLQQRATPFMAEQKAAIHSTV